MFYVAVGLLIIAGVVVLVQLWDVIRLLKKLPLSLVFLCGLGEEWLFPLAILIGIKQGWLKYEIVETKGIGRKIRKAVLMGMEVPPNCEWCRVVYGWVTQIGSIDVDLLRGLTDDIRALHYRLLEIVGRPVFRRRLLPVVLVLLLVSASVFFAYQVIWVWVAAGILLVLSFATAIFRPKVRVGGDVLDCSIAFADVDEELASLLALIRGLVRDGKA